MKKFLILALVLALAGGLTGVVCLSVKNGKGSSEATVDNTEPEVIFNKICDKTGFQLTRGADRTVFKPECWVTTTTENKDPYLLFEVDVSANNEIVFVVKNEILVAEILTETNIVREQMLIDPNYRQYANENNSSESAMAWQEGNKAYALLEDGIDCSSIWSIDSSKMEICLLYNFVDET